MNNFSDSYYMNIAYKEAQKAFYKNEIPVGAVIVSNGKVISKAHNLRDSNNIVTNHAEIIAIERANKKINNWRLIDCVIYTTLKPCRMCYEVIKESKIKEIIYSAPSRDNINFETVICRQIEDELLIEKSIDLIKEAFSNIRNK